MNRWYPPERPRKSGRGCARAALGGLGITVVVLAAGVLLLVGICSR